MKSAITNFYITFLSVGSVEFWLAKGARWRDYETLHLEVGAPRKHHGVHVAAQKCTPYGPIALYKHKTVS